MKKLFLLLLIMAAAISNVSAFQFKSDYWILQAKGGVGFPVFESANTLNAGFSGGISARRAFDAETSAGGGISIVNLPYKIGGAPGPMSATILQLEAVYAPYLPGFFLWPYAKVGMGLWMVKYANLSSAQVPQISDQSAFGFELGLGASYPLSNQFAANVEALYNSASMSGGTGDSYNFITFCVGVSMYIR